MLLCMARIDLIPERQSDGSVILRARPAGGAEWLRRILRRLAPAA
jgi:hypothetical protein